MFTEAINDMKEGLLIAGAPCRPLERMQVLIRNFRGYIPLFYTVYLDINIKKEKERPTHSEIFQLTHCYCIHCWVYSQIEQPELKVKYVILVDMPTGNDDGQRAPHHILHCWHREHCGPDGETPDAAHGLAGLHWNYTRGARGKEAVQNDMPRLWVGGCKRLLNRSKTDKSTVSLCVYGWIVSGERVHRWQMLFFCHYVSVLIWQTL